MLNTGIKHHSQPGELFSYSCYEKYASAIYPLPTHHICPTFYAVFYQAFCIYALAGGVDWILILLNNVENDGKKGQNFTLNPFDLNISKYIDS